MVVQRFLVNGIYAVFPWNQSRDDEYHQLGDSDGGFWKLDLRVNFGDG